MSNENMKREINEAILAGERALYSLSAAREKLNSAGGWGLWDMFGGGAITGFIKHARINEASRYVEDAKRDLATFQRELRDVSMPPQIRVEMGSLLTFFDFFCDGFLADFLVQSKISEAKKDVDEASRKVSEILSELRRQYQAL